MTKDGHMRRFYRMARRIFYIALFVLLADVLTVFFVGGIRNPNGLGGINNKYHDNPLGGEQYKADREFRERYDGELNPHKDLTIKMKMKVNNGWKVVTPVGLLLQHVFGYPTAPTTNEAYDTSSSNTPLFGYQIKPSITHLWGQYSPYFSVPSEIPSEVPPTCKVTFAQVLSRHGARDPTISRTMAYHAMIERMKIIAKDAGKEFEGKYAFINDYEYRLGYDQLNVFGKRQMYMSGVKFYDRYGDLARGGKFFVRSSDQQRVVDSAVNFTMGYLDASVADKKRDPSVKPKLAKIVEISEKDGMNNTLSHGLCTNFENGKAEKRHTKKTNQFMKTFIPRIQARLNNDLPGVVNLTDFETIMFMDLCPFETVAKEHAYPLSPFCDLFSPSEWKKYDYLRTIDKYYGHANGNPLGPSQGVGFVNELLSRMTHSPSYADNDHTTVNHTLDSNPSTFPLSKEYKLFADFSHDNDMVSIYAAMGLYNTTKPLSGKKSEDPSANGGFSTSWLVPFAGRMYVEKLLCAEDSGPEEYVRVLVNDRVIRLSNCGGDKDEYGRCRLSKWVESLEFARTGGVWDRCWD